MTDRDLLLEFVEWWENHPESVDYDFGKQLPTEEAVDAFLAQLVSPPGETAGKSDGPSFYGATPMPHAPHVKVTEVDGRLHRRGGHSCIDMGDPVRGAEMADIAPDEAWGEDGDGPRGRFRWTCEFWPAPALPRRLDGEPALSHRPQDDFVMVFDDKTAEQRTEQQMGSLVDALREAANAVGFDISMWGTREQVRRALNRSSELADPAPHVKVTES